MCVLSCLCLTTTSASSPVDQHIQRINYGIVFEKTHDIYLGQEHWLHTFQIPLPKKLYLPELYCNMPQCQTAGHIIKSLNLLRTQCMASVNSTVHHIHDLVPTTELPQERKFIGRSRSKRGLFDFVGKISKSLFGTATSGDIEALKRHMQVLNNNNVKLAEAMANHFSFGEFIFTRLHSHLYLTLKISSFRLPIFFNQKDSVTDGVIFALRSMCFPLLRLNCHLHIFYSTKQHCWY